MINIKNLNPNNAKIDGKSFKNIFYYTGHVTVKSITHMKINKLEH